MVPLSSTAWLRYEVIRRLIPRGDHRLLEIGAGVGSLSALLAERFDYVGVEPDPVSFKVARDRIGAQGHLILGTTDDLARSETFDILCAFEILEHIEDDRRALSEWLGHLRPGGWVLVSVPQGRRRFGPQDEFVGHCRRYDRSDLAILLNDVGLRDLTIVSYGFPLGNVLEAARNIVARRKAAGLPPEARTAASGRWLQPPSWASGATRALTLPFRFIQRPFARTSLGSGLVALGRLPELVEKP
jgi:SAM-dependent methyltransferase